MRAHSRQPLRLQILPSWGKVQPVFTPPFPATADIARPNAGAAVTPIAFVQAYRHYGVSPSAALQRAQIAPELLQIPGARITALQMELISGAAMQELDDEALGWFSRRLPWGSYGMLARASISAPSLGVTTG